MHEHGQTGATIQCKLVNKQTILIKLVPSLDQANNARRVMAEHCSAIIVLHTMARFNGASIHNHQLVIVHWQMICFLASTGPRASMSISFNCTLLDSTF